MENNLLAEVSEGVVMKEYGLFLDRRLIRCSTSKAAIWELLVRIVRELQAKKILPKRLVASPIAFSKAEGVMLSLQTRNVGAPSHTWTEIPGWSGPPKKPRGNSHQRVRVQLTAPTWLRAWVSSRTSKQPEPAVRDDPSQQASSGWLIKLQASGKRSASPAAESAYNATLRRPARVGPRCEEEEVEEWRQGAVAVTSPEDMERKEELLRKWLFTARCRLNLTDYSEFRHALGRLHSARSTCETAELCNLVKLLWCADFPEGPSTHATWMLDFAESLPRGMRWVWREAVHQFAPAPLSSPNSAGKSSEPSVDQKPAGQSSAGVDVHSSTSAAEPLRKEEGWLIKRSTVFLNRELRVETASDGTPLKKCRREML